MTEIKEVREIKTRQIGRKVWVDLYVSLPKTKTIEEVNTLSTWIRRDIAEKLEHLGNVNVICE
jgi:divalent metal cation (Fe/Co/Zn/Cd) transporter